jgi:hypothetical protein
MVVEPQRKWPVLSHRPLPSWARTKTLLIQSPPEWASIFGNLLGIGYLTSIGARFPAVVLPSFARRNCGKTAAGRTCRLRL